MLAMIAAVRESVDMRWVVCAVERRLDFVSVPDSVNS